ncbi:MAG: hypothetical protein ACYDHY_06900 [Acidiferrobacterales bacterium]
MSKVTSIVEIVKDKRRAEDALSFLEKNPEIAEKIEDPGILLGELTGLEGERLEKAVERAGQRWVCGERKPTDPEPETDPKVSG